MSLADDENKHRLCFA